MNKEHAKKISLALLDYYKDKKINVGNCKIDGCNKLAKNTGLCHMHYSRINRHGTLQRLNRKNGTCDIFGCTRKHRAKGMCIIHYSQMYDRQHPRSSAHYSIELRLAMDNVRRRDKNTCQWYGCNLTHREAPICVHHIFPRSEYPELELVERYMICYCSNHHGMFHRYRGDGYNGFINQRVCHRI